MPPWQTSTQKHDPCGYLHACVPWHVALMFASNAAGQAASTCAASPARAGSGGGGSRVGVGADVGCDEHAAIATVTAARACHRCR
jgi:hypothetical protein